jgi:hypothetical protein
MKSAFSRGRGDYGATGFMGLMRLMGRISFMSPIGPIRIFRRRVAVIGRSVCTFMRPSH